MYCEKLHTRQSDEACAKRWELSQTDRGRKSLPEIAVACGRCETGREISARLRADGPAAAPGELKAATIKRRLPSGFFTADALADIHPRTTWCTDVVCGRYKVTADEAAAFSAALKAVHDLDIAPALLRCGDGDRIKGEIFRQLDGRKAQEEKMVTAKQKMEQAQRAETPDETPDETPVCDGGCRPDETRPRYDDRLVLVDFRSYPHLYQFAQEEAHLNIRDLPNWILALINDHMQDKPNSREESAA